MSETGDRGQGKLFGQAHEFEPDPVTEGRLCQVCSRTREHPLHDGAREEATMRRKWRKANEISGWDEKE